jgi:prepilin-type N-terminal cleavage/methylation domain-containing protein
MTGVQTTVRSERGFTLIEMAMATAIMLVITATIFSMLNPSYGAFQAQPETADMQQRLRVVADTVQKDLMMAGAGMYSGQMVGTLDAYFSPLLPHKVGTVSPDPAGTFHSNPNCPETCTEAVTIMYVPTTTAQTTLSQDMPTPSSELKVNPEPGCPNDPSEQLCGFKEGMRVLIMSPDGDYDIFTITNVQDNAGHIQHRDDKFTTQFPAGSWITEVVSATYYLQDDGVNTPQLRYYDGYETDLPVADNIVDFRVEFFGDPSPPEIIKPPTGLAGDVGPWTTYGPRPPALGSTTLDQPFSAGENCIFKVDAGSGLQVPRPEMQTLGAAGTEPVLMPASMLTDGPWCPADKNIDGLDLPSKYDADMLRVRKVRLTFRVQVAQATLRGPAGTLFRHGGTSNSGSRFVPDQEVRFDVTPRNLNLGR